MNGSDLANGAVESLANLMVGLAVAAFGLGASFTVGVGALVYWLVW